MTSSAHHGLLGRLAAGENLSVDETTTAVCKCLTQMVIRTLVEKTLTRPSFAGSLIVSPIRARFRSLAYLTFLGPVILG